MMHSCIERKMITIWSMCLIFALSCSILAIASPVRHLCSPDQRDALWDFKSEFYVQESADFYWRPIDKKTERWRNNTDCCSWDGVSCNPKTGKVVELDLRESGLSGPLRSNSSLFRLQHLRSLYLGYNNLSGVLSDSIGNLKYLKVLRLTDCRFFGKIPSSIGNLSHLTDLDLFFNYFAGELPDSIGNLNRLTELKLGFNNLNGNFPPMLLNLSELTYIDLSYNQFKGMLPSNMSSLSKLVDFDISGNSFYGYIPSSLFMIPSLMYIDVESNSFSGSLAIENISSPSKLQYLLLGDNNFTGPIPGFISKLVGLSYLDLSYWKTGRCMVDFSFLSHLKSLKYLRLSHLNTRSMVDMNLFSHLMSLEELVLSGNNLKINSALHLPSSIEYLVLSSCNISEFPKFLQTPTNLVDLDISANQIEDQVPEWLWKLPKLMFVNISHNSFSGFEGSSEVMQRSVSIEMLDMSSNTFKGSLPLLPKSLEIFLASDNWFSGEIPRAICKLVNLMTLVLSSNNFSGSIPRCFENFRTTLVVLHLQNNSLSGDFPEESMGNKLRSLDIGHNRISGELPKSLINCTRLEFLNVEDNKFNDTFPFWLRLLPNLQILVLRSNDFHGTISSPGVPSSFHKLWIFDISRNHFSGILPSNYFAGWNEMSSVVYNMFFRVMDRRSSLYQQSVVTKSIGLKRELMGISFTVYKTLDVSGNRCEGNIPDSISLLKGLIVLNMSNNAFTGHIPPSLLNLTCLQSLDLSRNQFSGIFPPELGKLTFLELLDISSNNFQDPFPLLPSYMTYFLGSDNRFSGEIPKAICEMVSIETLVLSNNNFSGYIPRCFENIRTTLFALHLQNNSLSGGFPEEFVGDQLRSLDIGHNWLSGELPKSLINCTYLEFLNVEDNRFNDTFPFWLRLLPNLQILVLRSNHFHGPISSPGVSLSFPKLRIFDISGNRFAGVFPTEYFAGWSEMSSIVENTFWSVGSHSSYYPKSVVLTNKGLKMELIRICFTMYKTIDVSGNRFDGNIPESIGSLKELDVLNMSNNAFTGHIPPSMSNLTNLQSLDLSENRFSGKIPPELGKLTFLAKMNFSHNRLEGPIPQSTQIQTQNSSSFAENPGLCGAPLLKICGGEEEEATRQEQDEEKEKKDQVISWIAAAVAYVPGIFCGFVINHILNSYRQDWFMRIFRSFD